MLINLQPKAMMVSTDGSESSKEAFYQAFEFMTDEYHLYVAHISDSKKIYLPFEYKTTYIWEDYKNECLSRLISKRYDLVFQEKNYEEDNIRDQIIALAESLTINYIFLGYSGRKGKKMDPSLLGQTVKNSLYRTAIPLIVVKHLYKRTEKASKGFNFLVCIDGSDKSYKALEACLTLSKSENDEIYAVTASSLQGEYHTETIKVKFDEIAEKNKEKKLSFVILKPSHDPANAIIEYVNFNEKVDFDFVVLGNNGIRAQIEGKAFLGRMAERILANIKANPIIIP